MNITIKINCDNAAFQDSAFQEVKYILEGMLIKVERERNTLCADLTCLDGAWLYDSNGNKVGTVEVTQ